LEEGNAADLSVSVVMLLLQLIRICSRFTLVLEQMYFAHGLEELVTCKAHVQ
jgi:hypothetical protein